MKYGTFMLRKNFRYIVFFVFAVGLGVAMDVLFGVVLFSFLVFFGLFANDWRVGDVW